ncbi:MAG: hypothetical protein ACREQ5_20080, partial [Candidatus Dormibacteria bacterium]
MRTPRSAPRLPAVTALVALLGAVLATVLGAAPARAHEMDPHLRTVLESVIPPPPAGVTISVRNTVIASEMLVENHTPTEVQVLTDAGRTYLRIGPQGVLGDLDTPEWYQSNNPYGNANIPAKAQVAGAPPFWGRASHEPDWGWFEHRMHPKASMELPPAPPSGVQTISRWIVPMRYGTTDFKVLGRVDYVTFKGGYKALLTSTPTPFDGVSVSVIPARLPGVFLANTGTVPVVVTGRQGEPMLRIGPGGTEANLHSPSWVDNLKGHGDTPTVEADATAPPQWQLVHPEARELWLEFRGFYANELPPTEIIARTEPTVLLRWSIPLVRGTATATLTGTTSYVPDPRPASTAAAATDDGSFPWVGLVLWVCLLALAVGGAVMGLRWRRLRAATASAVADAVAEVEPPPPVAVTSPSEAETASPLVSSIEGQAPPPPILDGASGRFAWVPPTP